MLPDQFEYITDSDAIGMILTELDSGDPMWVNSLATRIETADAAEDIGWLGTPPALQEFIAGRDAKELAEYSFTVTTKDYESTIRVAKKSWRRDKTGMIQQRIGDLAKRVMDHPLSLISQLIVDGETELCFDGQAFFDIDHSSKNSGTQDNDLGASASTATAPTAAEMSTAIMAAVQAIYGFVDDEGEPTNQSVSEFGIMIPTSFLGSTLEAITSLLGANGGSNLLRSLADQGVMSFRAMPNPRLNADWTTKFVTFALNGGTKPFVLLEEGEMEPIVLGPGSEYAKVNNKCLAGVDWSGNVAYGDWSKAVLTTLS